VIKLFSSACEGTIKMGPVLFSECLQGEGLTTFIACVSPLGCDVSETLSTLRYADSAKNLKKPPLSTAFQSQVSCSLHLNRLDSFKIRFFIAS